MLDITRWLQVLSMDMVEDIEDGLLYVQFLSLVTRAVSQTGPFLVATKNPMFP